MSKTYRVRQIPANVSKDSLPVRLSKACAVSEDSIIVYSLASSLLPFERPPSKTATVAFNCLPALLDNDDNEWVIKTPEGQPNMIVDVHFFGFTPLNDVEPDLHALE